MDDSHEKVMLFEVVVSSNLKTIVVITRNLPQIG